VCLAEQRPYRLEPAVIARIEDSLKLCADSSGAGNRSGAGANISGRALNYQVPGFRVEAIDRTR